MKKLFLIFRLFNIEWSPYNGGVSLLFHLSFFTLGGMFTRSLFYFRYDKFHSAPNANVELQILFFSVIRRHYVYDPKSDSYVRKDSTAYTA